MRLGPAPTVELRVSLRSAHSETIKKGAPSAALGSHLKRRNWIREHRGIFRLAELPTAGRPDLILWYLCSQNRQEVPEGTCSHEPALSLHELTVEGMWMFRAQVFARLEWLYFVLEIREQQLAFGFGQLGDQLARVRNERAASGIGPA